MLMSNHRTQHVRSFVTKQSGGTSSQHICGPEKIRSRIFDPFFTTREVGQGTGQGLALAHNVIVNIHHGSISVESEEDAGATFILRLPLEAAREAESVHT
jgi:nitrogen-specific signal transduction histidine kinase